MPSNYVPRGGPGTIEHQQQCFDVTRQRIKKITAVVKNRETKPVEKGRLWQRIVFTAIYHLATPNLAKMDLSYKTDKKCNKCGISAKVNPGAKHLTHRRQTGLEPQMRAVLRMPGVVSAGSYPIWQKCEEISPLPPTGDSIKGRAE